MIFHRFMWIDEIIKLLRGIGGASLPKTYIPSNKEQSVSQIGATLEALADTIAKRRLGSEESYTRRLLIEDESFVLSKVVEEAHEVVEAAKEQDVDHLRYEVADVMYHLMVVLERHDIPLDEFAAELNMRMREDERPSGGVLLHEGFVKRGK